MKGDTSVDMILWHVISFHEILIIIFSNTLYVKYIYVYKGGEFVLEFYTGYSSVWTSGVPLKDMRATTDQNPL